MNGDIEQFILELVNRPANIKIGLTLLTKRKHRKH